MHLTLLEAINLVLPKLGEHPVTRVDVKHPTVAIILPELENTLKQLLLKGWWFNEFRYTATPDNAGEIAMGVDALTFTPGKTEPYAVLRAGRLYNPETLSYVWENPVKGTVRQYVPFEECPETAQQFIWYTTMVNVFATDIGMAQELQLWIGQATAAYGDLLAEHIRQRKYSTRQSGRYQRLRRAMVS